jgi:hypothetical protein
MSLVLDVVVDVVERKRKRSERGNERKELYTIESGAAAFCGEGRRRRQ